MADSQKDKGGLSGVAFAIVISFIAICVSIACLLHIFFLSAQYTRCSCPQNEQPRATQELLRNETGITKTARGPPKDYDDKKTRKDKGKRLQQPVEERRARKRRATTSQTQSNGNTAFGGYLHNAILRLQQQVIVLEGR